MKKVARIAIPLYVLAFVGLAVWGCQNGGLSRDGQTWDGSTLTGADDGAGSDNHDQESCEGCCADSMNHAQGDTCGMGDMGDMGDMHGGSGDMGDSVQSPGSDEHSGHH